MISYKPFHELLRAKNISKQSLIVKYGFSPNAIHRINHNQPMNTTTLDKLCTVLECSVSDIIEFEHPNRSVVLFDSELNFLKNYAEKTDFSNSVVTLPNGDKHYSGEMQKVRCLYNAYLVHNNIKVTDPVHDLITDIIIYKLQNNTTFPYKFKGTIKTFLSIDNYTTG